MSFETILGVKACLFPLLSGSSKCRGWQLLLIVRVWLLQGHSRVSEEVPHGRVKNTTEPEWALGGACDWVEDGCCLSCGGEITKFH